MSDLLTSFLSSRTRAAFLRLLFGLKTAPLHTRELARQAGVTARSVQKEASTLLKLGLLTVRKDGNRTYYDANRQHPIYKEIHDMVLKTSGLVDIINQALGNATGVSCAFIFGSIASGTENADSDIDLMVIGTVGLRKLSSLLSGVSEALGREINPHIMTQEEFGRRLKKNEHLISRILESPKIFVIGTEDELEAMGK
jgi:predicted nucleotidyltransferase